MATFSRLLLLGATAVMLAPAVTAQTWQQMQDQEYRRRADQQRLAIEQQRLQLDARRLQMQQEQYYMRQNWSPPQPQQQQSTRRPRW